MVLELFLCLLCTLTLLALSVTDIRTYEIPVGYNLLICMLGVVRLLFDFSHWYQYAAGFFVVSSLFLAVHLFTGGRAIGGGDIKLMAAAGLFLGWKHILLALAIGSAVALGVHAVLMVCKKKGRTFAFGPYLSVGIFCAMLWGEEIWRFLMQV